MRLIRGRSEAMRLNAARGAAVAMAYGALACGRPLAAPVPSADDAEARRGGTLRLASMADVRNLDPAGPSDALAAQAQRLLFDGLVDLDDSGRIVPVLAETWQVLDGGRTYRFTLRPDVRMQDGRELTAEDVKRSAERSLDPGSPNPDASTFDAIVGYDAFAAGKASHIEGIEVEGRYLVSFRLSEPDAAFLSILTMPALRPVCQTGGARFSRDWPPCGAGPFRLVAGDWQRGMSLRLVRNTAYFRAGFPRLDAIEWTFNMQPLAQRFRFESGQLD